VPVLVYWMGIAAGGFASCVSVGVCVWCSVCVRAETNV